MHTSAQASGGWRTSSRSANNGTCVELACLGTTHAIRDSKSPDTGTLSLTSVQSADFFAAVKAGVFDRRR
ncbi:putative DUF397 family protein [Actinoalloteichus sp. GBA129-24]|uniref:DUF397 family protein n=1 Tax=Actinoalloteichus fjordicus TaxID=1612552 RepID=A0AAC9PS82_9PSEU|nr:putative DUF397 family protein [Actinoalloteichus fjordicus]APU20539.1 putative DUF397 family protein [Actinoalloteichus sp. GBA129-24]